MAKDNDDGPVINFDMSLMQERNSKYTVDTKVEVVGKYMVYGNLKRVATELNIPYNTLKTWKRREWWPLLLAETRKAKQDELDGQLTGVIHDAVTKLTGVVANGNQVLGKDGKLKTVPLNGRDLAGIVHLMIDKRALMRGDPTQKVIRVSQEEALGKLADKMADIAQRLTEKEVTGEIINAED